VLGNVAVSGDRNVIKKVVEMILKPKLFILEIVNMIPEILGQLEPSHNHSHNTGNA
jgi:hypothetical protein